MQGPIKKSCTLYVCTSCRGPNHPREPQEERPGYLLYKQVRDCVKARALDAQVKVRPAECLSVCRRPCGIAMSCEGSWTYLFGDQSSEDGAQEIVDCAVLYLEKSDGYLVRSERPKRLRAGILGRVPPTL